MLYEILKYLGVLKYGADNTLVSDVRRGYFEIEGGSIALPNVKDGVYIAISGSDLNDGVYQYPCYGLNDETFCGVIHVIRNNPAFMAVVNEITEWQTKNGAPTAFASESFGGYSYSRATMANGSVAGWQQAYSERLKPWKKV